MGFQDLYREKLTTPERAVELVRSGDRVYIHPGCAEPETLVRALVKRAPALNNVEIVHMMTLGYADYVNPEYRDSFRHNSLFIGSNVRNAVDSGRADYTPIFLSEIENLFLSGEMPIDVVFVQVSPPDHQGYMSLGVSVD